MIYGLLAVITGVNLVFTTTFNSKIGTLKSVSVSAFINFLIGLFASGIVMILFYKTVDIQIVSSDWYIFTGGFIAVFIVMISNFVIANIGVFFATLLSVAGQLIMGTLIDWIRSGVYPIWPTVGGILIVLGLLYIHQVEKREIKKGAING
ncbi:MAG: DMT family transporter [Clostridiales bacterium]|nr:DMT family transporter [Clostridiales bacterium]